MTDDGAGRLKLKVKIDKTLAASIALHVLVLGWGLVSFSTKAYEMTPEDSVPVDVISPDQLAKVMAGMKTGKKENPKPLVDKVAEKPKEEPKPEKKPDPPKVDPSAEAIKKEEKKPPPKPVAQAAAKPPE